MTVLVEGRVVDRKGRGVPGARVVVDYSFAHEPASGFVDDGLGLQPSFALTGPDGRYAFTAEAHPELHEKIRRIQFRAEVLAGRNPHDLAARATAGKQASQRVVFDFAGERVRVPDLVLEPGVVGRVAARWSDRVPAAGVAIHVTLHDGVDPQALLLFRGTTDERGELTLGPVRARRYGISVTASHAGEPPHAASWKSRTLRAILRLTLPRGRTLLGRLETASGQPAAGYLVAPHDLVTGDPEPEQAVETDGEGRFALPGVRARDAEIAIYDRLPRDPLELYNPLLLHGVRDGTTDLGTLALPALGTLALHLEDARGGRPLSGSSLWSHSGKCHGALASLMDTDGIIRFERIPLGIAIDLRVTIEDSKHGELEQEFSVPEVTEEPVTLRVTGAGTVILRLHPAGAPDVPLRVRGCWAQFHQHHGLAHEQGWASELRGWVQPGAYPTLKITARDHRERVIRNLRVRDDGPTFVDVELERLPE